MEWFSKHMDAFIIISAIVGSMLWMNTRFNEIDKKFSDIEREIAVMKTVMIMKNIMPTELAKSSTNNINEMNKKG